MPTTIDGKMPVSIPKSVLTKLREGVPLRTTMATSMTAAGAIKVKAKP